MSAGDESAAVIPAKEGAIPPESSVTLSPGHLVTVSSIRAWLYLVWLSIQRQARARQMVWIALWLLVLTTTIILFNTSRGRWSMGYYPYEWANPEFKKWREKHRREDIPPEIPARIVQSHLQASRNMALVTQSLPWSPEVGGLFTAMTTAYRRALDESGIYVFVRWVVYSIFVSFLLPIWSLSFATEALGGERESRSLIWLLSRPMSRPAIYAAKYVALLPWTLGLNLGGFALICLAAGAPGREALRLFWPAVAAATLAFCALFHLMSAVFRRPAVVAICYTFFLETMLGTMPGYMKRISIGFYTRCMMFDAGSTVGILPPEKPSIYLPVDGTTALTVLLGATAALLVVGMIVFARSEYWEDL
jgi:ABC-2 type transport system permease protein